MINGGRGFTQRPTMEGPSPKRGAVYNVYNINEEVPDGPVQGKYASPTFQRRDFQQQQPLSRQKSEDSLNPLDPGYNCVVYDTTAEKGQRFKAYRKSKKKSMDVDEMATTINNLKLNTEKSPVTILNELMNLSKKKIDFEVVSVDGHVHSPVFTICAKCDDLIVFGQGSSKKIAKKNAAAAFLNQIDGNNSHNITSTISNPSFSSTNNINHTEQFLESIINLNPIGVLQELCIARHWELPSYTIEEHIVTQNYQYSIRCTLKIYSTKGEGKSKQLAKRKAASLMYDMVKNLSPKEILAFNFSKSISKTNNNEPSNDNLEEQNITNFGDTLRYLRIFFDELKSSKNVSINKLKELQLLDKSMVNVVEFLDNIGREEGFNVTYVLISTKSSDVEVLVQLVINPLVVNIGVGKTFEEAQEAAAYTSLIYLKLLLED